MTQTPDGVPLAADGPVELDVLLGVLAAQRRHVLGALDGLADDALRRAVLPSGWTCLGLVKHLTLDVERFWFRAVLGGQDVAMPSGDESWTVGPDVPADAVLDGYREECRLADAAVRAAGSPAAMPRDWPTELMGDTPMDLRGILLHVVTETACHAGHLDAVRELVDGTTWLVLT